MPKNTVGERRFFRLNTFSLAREMVSWVPWGRLEDAVAITSLAPLFSQAFFIVEEAELNAVIAPATFAALPLDVLVVSSVRAMVLVSR